MLGLSLINITSRLVRTNKQPDSVLFFSTNDTRLKQIKNIYEMNTANTSGEQTAASLSSMNAMRCSPAPHKCYAPIIRIKPFEHLLSSALRRCVASACRHS